MAIITKVGLPMRLREWDGTKWVTCIPLNAYHAHIVLSASAWSNNKQTVDVDIVDGTDEAKEMITPQSSTANDLNLCWDNGIMCIGFSAGKLTFGCVSVPSSDIGIDVYVRKIYDSSIS